jgi:hypothetical protein
VRDGVLSGRSHGQVEGLVCGRAESLSADGHHEEGVVGEEADEPFKAGQAAPRALEAEVEAGI